MKVDFTVPEQMVGRLAMGQSARFGAAEGELTHEGTITGIEPKTDPTTRLVLVRAEVDNTGGVFRPGQFVRVEVELPAEEGIIAVPQTAVTTSLYGDFVYTVGEEQVRDAPTLVARQVFVKTGRRSGGLVEITEGLAAGSTVVTSGQNKLDSGTPVTVDNSIDPAKLVGLAEG
jgi:membrane fusion protein (multidrug efflux system)